MKITSELRVHMAQKHGVATDASDDDVKTAVLEKFASGALSIEQLAELGSGEKPASNEDRLDRVVNAISERVEKSLDAKMDKMVAKAHQLSGNDGAALDDYDIAQNLPPGNPDPEVVLRAAAQHSEKNENIRVKKVSERYSNTKSALTYRNDRRGREGKPVMYLERGVEKGLDTLSEVEWAKTGAWMLLQMKKAGLKRTPLGLEEIPWNHPFFQHCSELCKETAHEDVFVGPMGSLDDDSQLFGRRKFSDYDIKTVLDESGGSGGGNAVPEFFDAALIVTPLLHGELLPYVNIIRVAKGGASDGASFGTSTFVSTASGSAVAEFGTDSFVSAFDTTFFPMTTAITFGLDFLSDAVASFAQQVAAQIGQEHLRWWDEQIAIGDGTTEPQGVFVATNTTVSGITNTFSSFTYDDILEIIFTINKQHRMKDGGRATRLIMNEPQYKEFLQILVNSEANHPTFGVRASLEYELAGWPVSIESNIANGNVGLCNLRGYRAYFRQGLQFQVITAGKTLALDNEQLLMARGRYGGQLELSGYMAELTA